MKRHKIILTDLPIFLKEHLQDIEFESIDLSKSNPGKGYSYLITSTSEVKVFPLSFHCIKYIYECTPNHMESFWIYNDPDEMNRWTVIPYRSSEVNSFRMIPDKNLYLSDDELEILVHLSSSIRKTMPQEFVEDPVALWDTLKNLDYSAKLK